ncbi:MAG: hypothetical protein KDC76_13950 [Bacteroidetes bacterium]|nr:hypothetical protein [Bacteroidota bacterium]
MLYQLRNLNTREQELMMDGPVLVGILIGSADGNLSSEEVRRLNDLVKTKVYSEKNDVHLLYKQLAETDLSDRITAIAGETAEKDTVEEKEEFLIGRLAGLNPILKKLDHAYAVQYRDSLKDIAVGIANASGGILGIGRVSHEEEELLSLSFIEHP